jgi:hypothetical protein
VRFSLMLERGKAALGEGSGSIGNLIPGHLVRAGLIDVRTVISQKTPTLYPPYDSEEQRVLAEQLLNAETWVGVRSEAERHFLAAGGSADEFDATWKRRLAEHQEDSSAVREHRFHTAGGFILYLTVGRRPA